MPAVAKVKVRYLGLGMTRNIITNFSVNMQMLRLVLSPFSL